LYPTSRTCCAPSDSGSLSLSLANVFCAGSSLAGAQANSENDNPSDSNDVRNKALQLESFLVVISFYPLGSCVREESRVSELNESEADISHLADRDYQ
jgi:hypothetical protein